MQSGSPHGCCPLVAYALLSACFPRTIFIYEDSAPSILFAFPFNLLNLVAKLKPTQPQFQLLLVLRAVLHGLPAQCCFQIFQDFINRRCMQVIMKILVSSPIIALSASQLFCIWRTQEILPPGISFNATCTVHEAFWIILSWQRLSVTDLHFLFYNFLLVCLLENYCLQNHHSDALMLHGWCTVMLMLTSPRAGIQNGP